uniref:Uncharacterized protein n=1 Tax=Anguilla anguilla TaxID=7936 RepID=A0A0E9QVW4_ANGAN
MVSASLYAFLFSHVFHFPFIF